MENTAKKLYKRWLVLAPLGLILIGAGACCIAESAILKYAEATTWQWVMAGTGSLIVFNAGICLFGDAVIARVRYLQLKDSV